jgi:hypothetical protein
VRPVAGAVTWGGGFIAWELMVHAEFYSAQARLARIAGAGGLTGASQAAYEHGLTHLIKVGPFGDAPGVSKLVTVRVLDPVYHEDTMTVALRWEATGGALSGSYRPPLGRIGAALDTAILNRVAAATIRALLRSVAGAVASPAAAGHSAEDPGPRWRLSPESGMP